MGSGFADSVMQLEPGRWHGPVLSGFGTHVVYVSAFEPAPAPQLADVRDDVIERVAARAGGEVRRGIPREPEDPLRDRDRGFRNRSSIGCFEPGGVGQDVVIPDGAPGS